MDFLNLIYQSANFQSGHRLLLRQLQCQFQKEAYAENRGSLILIFEISEGYKIITSLKDIIFQQYNGVWQPLG